MAITHSGWLAADRELNRAAKAAGFVSFSVAHDAPPLVFCVMTRSGAQTLATISSAKSVGFLDAQRYGEARYADESVDAIRLGG
jgi:hypothetical protein